jgi:transcriptional regulator with XRE-family HTH domain
MDNITNLTFQECTQIQMLISRLERGTTSKSIRKRLSLLTGTKINTAFLAKKAGVSNGTLNGFENELIDTSVSKLIAIKKAYQSILDDFKTTNNIVIDNAFIINQMQQTEVEPVFA